MCVLSEFIYRCVNILIIPLISSPSKFLVVWFLMTIVLSIFCFVLFNVMWACVFFCLCNVNDAFSIAMNNFYCSLWFMLFILSLCFVWTNSREMKEKWTLVSAGLGGTSLSYKIAIWQIQHTTSSKIVTRENREETKRTYLRVIVSFSPLGGT